MIDLHCHILPAMDDGSPSFEESVNMVRLAAENKIEAVIATPHFMKYAEIEDFVFYRDEKLRRLNEMIRENGLRVVVGAGAEVYLDNKVFTAGNMDALTINGSRYMLCEYSLRSFNPKYALMYAEELLDRGYSPIIAHPERYATFYEFPETVNELYSLGCRFQVNASSLAGHGGEQVQDFACELITRGFVDFIATDAHSSVKRANNILEKIAEFPEEVTPQDVKRMTEQMPMLVIKDEPLPKREVDWF